MNSSYDHVQTRPVRPIVTISASCILLLVSLLHVVQSHPEQWQTRPDITCVNGQETHRFATVNALRVNIRDLPTVFSNVLAQANAPDKFVLVCEFGVWSRIVALDIGEETWISSGLITLADAQPITWRMRLLIAGMLTIGLSGLLISIYRPNWIRWFQNLLLQTQELPPHARPLISNPRKGM